MKKNEVATKNISDEKIKIMDEILQSPIKAPTKKIEKVHTKLGDLR